MSSEVKRRRYPEDQKTGFPVFFLFSFSLHYSLESKAPRKWKSHVQTLCRPKLKCLIPEKVDPGKTYFYTCRDLSWGRQNLTQASLARICTQDD